MVKMSRSGSVCLDVINQSWSPMYDLTNIFEVFLPQLLTYPNPTDPLNGEAASLQMREPERYREKVKEYVKKYAKPEDFPIGNGRDEKNEDDDGSDFSMSDSEDGQYEETEEDSEKTGAGNLLFDDDDVTSSGKDGKVKAGSSMSGHLQNGSNAADPR